MLCLLDVNSIPGLVYLQLKICHLCSSHGTGVIRVTLVAQLSNSNGKLMVMAVMCVLQMSQLSFITHMAQLSNSSGVVVSITHMAQMLQVSNGMTVICTRGSQKVLGNPLLTENER